MKTLAPTIFLLLFTVISSAQQRPLLTDDAETIESGSSSISFGTDYLNNAKFPLSGLKGNLTRFADIRMRSAFGSNFELQIEGAVQNFLNIKTRGTSKVPLSFTGSSTNDWDDFIMSAKVRLFNESKSAPAIALKLGYQMPNSDQSKGIGTNQINVFSKLIVQKKFGDVVEGTSKANIYGNLGLGIMNSPLGNFSQNDVVLYGLAGIFRMSKRVNLATEINGRMNTRSGSAPVGTESVGQYRLGFQFKAARFRFDSAAIFGTTSNSPRSGITFGVTYFSPKLFK